LLAGLSLLPTHLLKLAEDWLDLANLTHSQSGQRVRKIREHPLVRLNSGREINGRRDAAPSQSEPPRLFLCAPTAQFLSTELLRGIAVAVAAERRSKMGDLKLFVLGTGSVAITLAALIVLWFS
jgi:hypothetical protein